MRADASADADADASADADALPAVKTEAAFARALREHRTGLLVVNYGAAWCTHCAKLSPTLRRLRREYEGGDDGARVSSSGGSGCLLYTSPSPRDRQKSRMPSSA